MSTCRICDTNHHDTKDHPFTPRRVGLAQISVEGLWLRRIGNKVEVLAEHNGEWYLIMAEQFDGIFSHIYEPSGIQGIFDGPKGF